MKTKKMNKRSVLHIVRPDLEEIEAALLAMQTQLEKSDSGAHVLSPFGCDCHHDCPPCDKETRIAHLKEIRQTVKILMDGFETKGDNTHEN